MTVYIDADSCPAEVRDYVIQFCNQKDIKLVLAANHEISSKDNHLFQMVICSKEKDAADNYIISNACSALFETNSCADDRYGYSLEKKITSADCIKAGSDRVITRDLLLANKLVEKNIACINDRGTDFISENIEKLLKDREEELMYVSMGLVKHSKRTTFSKKEFSNFLDTFSRTLAL